MEYLRREIDESPLRIGGDEFDGHSVAYVETFATLDQLSVDVGIEGADEGSVVVHAGDDGAVALADVGVQHDRRDALLHLALHLAGGVFHLGASQCNWH